MGAWSFDEASGTGVLDSSGKGNHGTVSGAKRVAGRFGGALQFDGVDDMVTVADADSLDLTQAMTLEAWVKPTALGTMWRTVAIKEQRSQLVYALYAGNGKGRPSGHVYTTGDKAVAGPSSVPTGTWTHIATTWDGRTLRLYINGAEVATASLRQEAVRSGRPLRFGGNTVWREWFKGTIDEIRVYNRALTPAELEADRSMSIAVIRDLTTKVRRPAANKKKKNARKLRGSKRQQRGHRTRWLR